MCRFAGDVDNKDRERKWSMFDVDGHHTNKEVKITLRDHKLPGIVKKVRW